MAGWEDLYEGFTRWMARNVDTFIEIGICITLLAVGVIVGVILAISRMAGGH